MFNFDDVANSIMSRVVPAVAPQQVISIEILPSNFEDYKQFVARDVMHEDDLMPDHQVIQQLVSVGNLEHLNAFLHQLGYCDEGIEKLQRKFILQGS